MATVTYFWPLGVNQTLELMYTESSLPVDVTGHTAELKFYKAGVNVLTLTNPLLQVNGLIRFTLTPNQVRKVDATTYQLKITKLAVTTLAQDGTAYVKHADGRAGLRILNEGQAVPPSPKTPPGTAVFFRTS